VTRYIDIHPETPQPRAVAQVAEILRADGLIAYPTDSGYALGCLSGRARELERIREIRGLDDRHHFTLVCHDVSQASQFAILDNSAFRAIRACTPGPYTFILPATKEVPRRLLHPKKQTVGIRIPGGAVVPALLDAVREPLVSSTLLLPGDEQPMTQGWDVKERLDDLVEAVVDAGDCGDVPTTVIDLSGSEPVVLRVGGGDPARFG
jgi:tRNA threonylcarbamoyl adenosine modification protein (Sua5/YciO/YrdC/YwlC family)